MEKIKKNIHIFLFFIAVIFILAVSIFTLTTKPKIWVDEAKSVELAINFQRFGVLDIQTAPNEFSGISYLLQSTGYPVTVPLAGLFALFGFSMVTARIYMLFWMIAMLYGTFFFLKRLFGVREALFAIALIATFASFHDNGRTVVGEIPGFLFMICGLWIILWKSDFQHRVLEVGLPFMAGVFFGLAVVTKPSVYIAVLPAITIALFFSGKGTKKWFFKMCMIAVGAIIPAALWFFIVIGNPINSLFWKDLFNFWSNPFNAESVGNNVIHNIGGIIFSTTLLYFGTFFVMLLAAAKQFWQNTEQRIFFTFLALYSIFAFLYYLRSPGWLRYIIAAELLILMAVPRAVDIVMSWPYFRGAKNGSYIILSILILVQIVHFFTAAQIYTSDSALRAGEYINREFPSRSIGILNAITLGIFINSAQKYQVITMLGIPQLGQNLLFRTSLPDIVVSVPNQRFLQEAQNIIANKYVFSEEKFGYQIYILR